MQTLSDRLGGRLASPWRRLMANLLESFIGTVLSCAALIPSGALSVIMNPQNRQDVGEAIAIGIIGWLSLCGVSLLFAAVQIYLWTKGTSIGKRLLGMWVVYEDGRPASFGTMLVRELVGKPISALVLYLGYLWILLDAHHQGWHDKLVRTYVVLRES